MLKSPTIMVGTRGFAGLVSHRRGFASITLHTVMLVGACNVPDNELEYGEVSSEVSVGDYQTSTCSTGVVVGLSKQIAEEIGCMNPASMVPFAAGGNLKFSSNAVLPYLSEKGKTDLLKVSANRVVQVNSGFRTVAQQYLLYRWFQLGRCSIPDAADPGTSNHESGRALDLANYSELVGPMANQNWSHSVPGDPVHFDHLGSPDIRGRDVLAFQRLWNRNHPNDQIAEDGDYGPMTEARLKQAPATGFAKGACNSARGVEVVSVDGPDRVKPGTYAEYTITLKNNGTTSWPATTKLATADGSDSELFDQDTWDSPSVVGELGTAIAAGEKGIYDLRVLAPVVAEGTAINTELALSSDGTRFGSIPVMLTVTQAGGDDTSGDGDDANDTGGGCSTGTGTSWAVLVFPLAILWRRRRRLHTSDLAR